MNNFFYTHLVLLMKFKVFQATYIATVCVLKMP